MEELLQQTMWYNKLVLRPLIPLHLLLPHAAQSWLRNYIGGFLLYLTSAYFLYIRSLKKSNESTYAGFEGSRGRGRLLLSQAWFSTKSMLLFACMPTFSEYMIEKGWTRCYSSISHVGAARYAAFTIAYLVLVEISIYWAHRALHDIKPLYKYLHAQHHSYNKENMLSPFAGMALHPLDGIMQGCPYVICLFIVPMHFPSYMILLFVEAIWTANIHDNVDGKVWPIMGAGYHTIHHTKHRYNYGKYTIWMDWMFGTLQAPIRAKAS